MKNVSQKTVGLVQLALLGAIIVLMTLIPFLGYIPLGVIRATIIHVPVIIGSILLGPKKGAALGFLFGLTSLLNNTFNPTITSFVFTPFYSAAGLGGNPLSLIICFVPRILVGIVPYYVYQLLTKKCFHQKKGHVVSLGIAGIAGAMTNTILVMNMIYLFFGQSYAQAREIAFSQLYTVAILPVVGINGVLEAIISAILVTAVTKPLLKYNSSFRD
jgi:uncharacterized membrane protein